jgi:hypothetical protein
MTTITQKRKLSKSAWLLIILAGVALIALILCSALGIIDLSWLGVGYLSIFMAASTDLVIAVLISAGFFALGVLTYWTLIKYFIGNKVTTAPGAQPGYAPVPTYPSQPSQSGQETKIS